MKKLLFILVQALTCHVENFFYVNLTLFKDHLFSMFPSIPNTCNTHTLNPKPKSIPVFQVGFSLG